MGCSSFCEFTVKLKNKKKIQWRCGMSTETALARSFKKIDYGD